MWPVTLTKETFNGKFIFWAVKLFFYDGTIAKYFGVSLKYLFSILTLLWVDKGFRKVRSLNDQLGFSKWDFCIKVHRTLIFALCFSIGLGFIVTELQRNWSLTLLENFIVKTDSVTLIIVGNFPVSSF